MVKILLISLLLLSKVTFSQVLDSFNDGDFTKLPTWHGDVNYFQVNTDLKLQSNGENLPNQTIYLSTNQRLSKNVQWTFSLLLNFDPTSTNFCRIYLISDQENLKGPLNGYYLQLGETGNTDAIHLYKQNGTRSTLIFSSQPIVRLNAQVLYLNFKITRNFEGEWNLYNKIKDEEDFFHHGKVIDNTYDNSSFFGIYFKYNTPTRFNQLIFDDLRVEELEPDLNPPHLNNIYGNGDNKLIIIYTNLMDEESVKEISNYKLLPQNIHPTEIIKNGISNEYTLIFEVNIPNGYNNLEITKVKTYNHISAPDAIIGKFIFVNNKQPKKGEVIINEIYANPSSNTNLPTQEFVELYNTTDEYWLMKGWEYSDKTKGVILTNDTLKPKQYLILSAEADVLMFEKFGKTVSINPWPTLNNDGDLLTLFSNEGHIIDQVEYSNLWYGEDKKKNGGYSLERINPLNICEGIQNWQGSVDDIGASPGTVNSVHNKHLDLTDLRVVKAYWLDDFSIEVQFSKSVNRLTAEIVENYTLKPIDPRLSASVIIDQPFNKAKIVFSKALIKGESYELVVNQISDCSGSIVNPQFNSFKFYIAPKPNKGDWLISEVLFNPKPNEVDFVEVYNNSNNTLDLKDLQIGNLNNKLEISSLKTISDTSLLVQPKSFWVLTTKPQIVKESYYSKFPEHFSEMKSFPSYNMDRGTVLLYSNENIIDRLDYSEDMHLEILKIQKGVSLERVSFDIEANAKDNFVSASALNNFATPTFKNESLKEAKNWVKLKSKTFSPDGDGFEDKAELEFNLTTINQIATVNVYNDQGVLVKRILKNQNVSNTGLIEWDGLNENGEICKTGVYIILFEIFSVEGKSVQFKNLIALANRY